MPNHSGGDEFGFCPVPGSVDARTIVAGQDRRAFARRSLRAGEVVLRNAPTAHALFCEQRRERCAHCLSTTRGAGDEKISRSTKLLRCGGCKQIWYCSRDCQKEDFFFHRVECKQSSILLTPAEIGQQSDDAALLVRNFLALHVRRNGNNPKHGGSSDSNECCQPSKDGTVRCGSDHFESLQQYRKERPLDARERQDIRRAARALLNQRTTLHKQLKNTSSDALRSLSELEERLEGDLRRFRVNNFGVTNPMVRVVASGVYPLGALLNHSCAPNCLLRYDFASSGGSAQRRVAPPMEIVAARDISEGEELTHSYVELVSSVDSRRSNLREIYGFDCHCARCQAPPAGGVFQTTLPGNYRSLSPIGLTQWVLQHCNPAAPCQDNDSSLVRVNQDLLLQPPSFDDTTSDSNGTAVVDAGKAKQREAQCCMINGDMDGELACLKEAVRLFESLLKPTATPTHTLPLSLDLYKARCDRLGSLIVAGGEAFLEEALVECEHVVSFLCLALNHVPNHSLLGLQLFTLGDLYEANGKRDKAQSSYIWARRTLRISQGARSDMVVMLNEKIIKS